MILDILKEAYTIAKAKRAAAAEAAERARVAKTFNDVYTYRYRWDNSQELLPGWGYLRGGYAWMCPDCNKVHLATSCSGMSGLQYPECCTTREGHRLYYGIKTK